MNKSVDEYLDEMCAKIKYRACRREIREEVRSHIEETVQSYISGGYSKEEAERIALSRMGDASELGDIFNKQCRLPFNCRFGLAVWSALVTVIIYLLYPLFHKLNNFTIPLRYGNLIIIASFAVLALASCLYLKRGRLKTNIYDIWLVTAGFLIGAAVSLGGLFAASSFVKIGYYPYFPDVKIMFMNTVGMYGYEVKSFANEIMIYIFCLVVYMLSTETKNKKKSFAFAAHLPGMPGYLEIDDEFYK